MTTYITLDKKRSTHILQNFQAKEKVY